jgi:uncharacterized protein (DUF302 family)
MVEPAGLVSIVVTASVVETVAHLEKAVAAAAAGLELRPTTLLLIGDAHGGTPLMQLRQVAGIDLPLRILAWEDEAGLCHLTYADPLWMAEARNLGLQAEALAARLGETLAKVAHAGAV